MRKLFAALAASLVFPHSVLSQPVDSAAVLQKIPLLHFWNKSPNCAKDKNLSYQSPQVGSLKDLTDKISSVDGAVLFIGDGDHSNKDQEFLLTHLISGLMRSGKSVRVYVESVDLADPSGFAALTPEYYLFSITVPKAQWHRVGVKTVDPEAQDNFHRFLTKMQGQGLLSAFAVDRGEGSPFHDADIAWMDLDAQNRFLSGKRAYFRKFGTKKQPERFVQNHYRNFTQSPQELAKFVAASELYRSYMLTKTWLPDLQVSLEKRNQQDGNVAGRIADDIKAHPESTSVVIYGVRHYRDSDNSLDAQIVKALPEARPRAMWSMYPTTNLLLETECKIGLSLGEQGTYVSIVPRGTVPSLPVAMRDLFVPGAPNP